MFGNFSLIEILTHYPERNENNETLPPRFIAGRFSSKAATRFCYLDHVGYICSPTILKKKQSFRGGKL